MTRSLSYNEQLVVDLNKDLIYSGSDLRVDYRRWTLDYNESSRPFKLIINGKLQSYGKFVSLRAAVEKHK